MCVYKILIRGSIVSGKLYCDETFIFGEGLITAYCLENDEAIYPRIIIQNEIIEHDIKECIEVIEEMKYNKLNADQINEENVYNSYSNAMLDDLLNNNEIDEEFYNKWYDNYKHIKIIKDFDGRYYIDYLNILDFYPFDYISDAKYYFEIGYRNTIKFYMKNFSDNLHVMKKLLWCCNYANNSFLIEYREKNFTKDIILEETNISLDKIYNCILQDYKQEHTKNEKMHLLYLMKIINEL